MRGPACRPRLRAADAWRRLLDDDGAFGSAAPGAPPPRFPRAFGAASQTLALWLEGARVAGDTVGHADARSGFPPANLAGSAPEVLAVLDTLVARAAQPAAAAALASALARLRDVGARAAGAAMLRAEAPAKLRAAAAAQFRAWGPGGPAAAAAADASVLDDFEPEDGRATSPRVSSARDGDGENETDGARFAARVATLSLLSSALEDGGAALGAGALAASPLIDLLFELLWRSETRAFAVKSLVALITSRCRRSGGGFQETAASALEAEKAWDALVRRFLQTLPAAREAAAGRGALRNATRGQGFGPLSDMLAGLRAALAGPGGKELRLRLASPGPSANASPAYVQVVSLLNAERGVEDGGSGGEAAALECVRTLRSLLSGSETAARAFERDVGYDTFAHALEAAWGAEPVSEALARSVLELAVDADLPTSSPSVEGDASEPIVPAGAAIRNAGALPVLLTLLRRAALPVRRWGLGALAALLASAVRSRAAADQSDALGFLLDWFAEEAAGEALSSPGTPRRTLRKAESDRREDDDAKTTVKTVPELISQCVGLCASHSLSARHFRGAFRILRDADVPAGARRAVLRALRLAAKREGPAAYFDLAPGDASGADGEDGPGCLALRRPPAWPSGRAGYTFAAWLRVETWRSEHLSERLGAEPNLKGSDDAERLAPRVALFAMRGASEMGVAAELGPSGVWLRVLEHAKAERVLLDARIETKRWMFVAVAHAPARPPLSSATARLYVDGELVSSKKLRFPRVAEPLTSCVIGAFDAFDAAAARVPERGDASFVSASSFGSQNSSAEPFRGQIGVVRFFDDALSAAAVAAAAALGPDYVGAFSPTETASGIALANFGMSHSEAREIREALAPRLVLSLNAAAATGRSCFSTVADPAGGGVLAALAAARARVESRIKDGVAGAMAGIASGDTAGPGDGTSASGTSPVAAELAGAARVCATHSAKDVVHCLGGVHVLFPLLAPGALGSGDGPRARSSELLVSKKMNATLDSNGPGLVVDAVDLLASLLEGSRLNQEALHTSGGFALVGRLLKMDGGARLSPALLPSAERLVRSVGRYAWAGPGNDPDQAAVRLLLDPHLWGAPRVSTETLAAHSAFLRRLAKRDPEALRALLPPPALVDAAAETGGERFGFGTVADRRGRSRRSS